MLLTRLPLYSQGRPHFLVRLACVRHAASVDSEPGSNSPIMLKSPEFQRIQATDNFLGMDVLDTHYLVIKDLGSH